MRGADEDESGGVLAQPVIDFLESLLSGASGALEERYGGEHLMLFDVGVLSGPVQMTLEFADGTVINTQLDIRDLTP